MSVWTLLAVVAIGWLAGWWLLWRVPGLDAAAPDEQLADVAVVIPARNEADSLPLLLDDLAHQHRRPAQIVVVDDASDDATAALAAGHGVDVVRTAGPPPGWAGKPWACWRGAESTGGAAIVFLDADVRLAPDAVARLLATHAASGGLLSVQPRHVVGRAVEGVSTVANVVVLAGTGAFTPRPAVPTVAFGPCLVCDRGDYLAVGGHAAVRRAVAEDAALAQRFRAAGHPVTLRGGHEAVTFRMYRHGLRPLVEGWSKNLAIGAGAAPLNATVLTVTWVAALLAAPALVARLAGWSLLAAGAVAAAMVVEVWWMARRAGRFGWWPIVLFPLAALAFVALFAWSMMRIHLFGSVAWRGRRIAVGGPE
jgi:4,4'-diaponeurosporenoate glycosyltransferase